MAKKKQTSKKNQIESLTIAVNGANQISIDNHIGRSVQEVRSVLRDILNIATDAKAKIGGKDIAGSHVIAQGEQLEFVKASGTKG